MAKLDLRMQFNEQCFLINNPGVVKRAVQLTEGRYVWPPSDWGAGRSYYLASDVTNNDTTYNSIRADPSYLFHNYFDLFKTNADKIGSPVKVPEVDFHFYKSYPKAGYSSAAVTAYEDVAIPLNRAFSGLDYSETKDRKVSQAFGTPIGIADVHHLTLNYSGKDFAHSNVVECEITLQVDSIQALLRRVNVGGRFISLTDLMRQPSKKVAPGAPDPHQVAADVLNIATAYGHSKATDEQVKDAISGHLSLIHI